MLTDLTQASDFVSYSSSWHTNASSSSSITTCGSYMQLLGGYGVSGKRVYYYKNFTNLPTHTQVRLDFGLLFGDDWNNNKFKIHADGYSTIYSRTHSSSSFTTSYCGKSTGDLYIQDSVTVSSHTNSYIAFYFSSDLDVDATTGWYAINNLRISMCDASCYTCNGPNSNNCTSCYSPTSLQSDGTCASNCISGQYTASTSPIQCLSN